MVYYADLRAPAFKVEVNANFVRTVLEETLEIELDDDDVLEAVCLRVEYEVRFQLAGGMDMDMVSEIILTCYHNETMMGK